MRAAIAVIGLWLLLVAPAAADVYDDNPATASRGAGDAWVFARATSGEILERHWNGTAWTAWASLGGNATSGPAAVAYGNSVLVFTRGLDGAVYQNTFADGKWTGWGSLGGYVTSAPAVTVRRGADAYVDLAAKGIDNAIYFRSFVPGTGWSNWASIGGNLASAPALNSQANGIVNIWARGPDGTLEQKAWDGTKWIEWGSLGGGLSAAPAAVSRSENIVDIFVRGTDNATYQRSWTSPGGWGPWLLLDAAPIESAPATAASDGAHEWLFARRGGAIAQKAWSATDGWSDWVDFGPVAVPAPPAPTPAAPTAPAQDGEVSLTTGVRCTPVTGRLRVNLAVRTPKGQAKAHVTKIVFYTKGKGRSVVVDRKAPFSVRIKVNQSAGKIGRVYARVYYRRSAKGALHRKIVSRRYTVCQ